MAVIRQEINIIDTTAGSASGIVLGNEGYIQIDTAQYVSPSIYFEVVISTAAASSTVTLRRKGTTTDDASISTTSTGRKASATFTPPTGKTEYGIFSANTTIRIKAARVIIIDTPTTLTSSETQIEVGGNQAFTATTATALTAPKYWTYTAAHWDGTITFDAEVSYKTASTNTATITLQEDDAAFGTWTDKITIVSAVSNTSVTRTRTTAHFTPTDGRHYRLAVKSSTTKSSVTILNAKVVVNQTGTPGTDDSYSESNQNTTDVLRASPGNAGAGQAFTSNGGVLKTAKLYLQKTGSPTGTATISVYATTGTIGTNAIPTGSALDSTTLDVSTLGTSLALVTFTFTGKYLLSAGTNYALTIEYNGGDVSNNVGVGIDSTSPTHAGNRVLKSSGGSWSGTSLFDTCFYVLVEAAPFPTLLEPQCLLLNTADAGTGLQTYQTIYRTTDWDAGNLGTITFEHAMDSDNASNSARLQITSNTNYITDNFTRADSGTLGSNWTDDTAGFGIVSNQAKTTQAAQSYYSGTFSPQSADYEVQADVERVTAVGQVGVIGRRTASDTYYKLIINTFDQTLKLFKVVGGSATQLGSTFSGGYSNGTFYTLKLSMSGSDIRGSEGGTERITATDSAITAVGEAGITADSNGAIVDNFIAQEATIVGNSIVTGANQQISSALDMPVSGDQIDVNVTNSTGTVAASRILAVYSYANSSFTWQELTATEIPVMEPDQVVSY